MTYEYRCEVLPVDAGPEGRTAAILNRFALEGWRLHSSSVVMAGPRVQTDFGTSAAGVGLLVILEREKVT